MLPTGKRGNISSGLTKIVIGVVLFFIGIILIALLAAALFPELVLALGNLSALNIPLASLFTPTGILMLIIVVVVFITILVLAFKLPQIAGGRR